jgi:hypothetical protein
MLKINAPVKSSFRAVDPRLRSFCCPSNLACVVQCRRGLGESCFAITIILVVEDDPYKAVLKTRSAMGFEIAVAASGEEGR